MELISRYLDGCRYFCHWSNGDNHQYGDQVKVRSREDTIYRIQQFNGMENCGISISTIKYGVPILLYLPFDFDSDDLEDAFRDSIKLYNFLVELDFNVSLHFSGNKGFHVLVPVVPDNYSKNQLRRTLNFFTNILNLKTLDIKVTQDIKRIIRIPGTYHTESGNICYKINEHNDGYLFNISHLSPPQYTKFKSHTTNTTRTLNHEYPCVKRYLKDKKYWRKNHSRSKFEPDWILRFAYVIEQDIKGKSEKEILNKMAEFEWDDWNEEKSLYNIRYIMNKEYLHPNCETLQDCGYCLDDCPYKKKWKPLKVMEND